MCYKCVDNLDNDLDFITFLLQSRFCCDECIEKYVENWIVVCLEQGFRFTHLEMI